VIRVRGLRKVYRSETIALVMAVEFASSRPRAPLV
jgi:hypothetical protein